MRKRGREREGRPRACALSRTVTHCRAFGIPDAVYSCPSLQESASCQPHHEAGSGSDGPGLPVCAPGWGRAADSGRRLLRADPRSRPQRYSPQASRAAPPTWRLVGRRVTWETQPGGGSKECFTQRPIVVGRVSNFKRSLPNPNKNIQMHRSWKKSWKETHCRISSCASEHRAQEGEARLSTAQLSPQIKYKTGAASRVRCLGLQANLEGTSEKLQFPSASGRFLPHPDEVSLTCVLHRPRRAFSPTGSRPRDQSLPSAVVSHHLTPCCGQGLANELPGEGRSAES